MLTLPWGFLLRKAQLAQGISLVPSRKCFRETKVDLRCDRSSSRDGFRYIT